MSEILYSITVLGCGHDNSAGLSSEIRDCGSPHYIVHAVGTSYNVSSLQRGNKQHKQRDSFNAHFWKAVAVRVDQIMDQVQIEVQPAVVMNS